MTTGAWRRIGEGGPGGAILAVDFDSTARAEAGFGKLARLLEPPYDMWLTTQPVASERELLSADAYLRWWRGRPEQARVRTRAVLGYCVGSVFAAALADEIEAEEGTRPPLLLIDPEPVDRLSPYRDFRKAVDGMSVLSEQERAGWTAEALAACQAADSDFGAVVGAVAKLYEAASGLAFERLGLDEETGGELQDVFRSYLSYLHGARQLHPERGWAEGVVLTSEQSRPRTVRARSEQRFALDTARMLDDRSVAQAVHLFLKEHAA